MGKTRTPRLIIALITNIGTHAAEWRVRKSGQMPGYGQPTPDNVQKYVDTWEASFRPGGVNHQASGGKVVQVHTAYVRNQITADVLYEVTFTRKG